jgi:hypothetical protein
MGIYNKLPDVDYLGVVVQGSVDTMHRGAVKARILGVTEEFDDENQPYVYPALVGGIQQVPQVGYYLRVRFEDGDINRGTYYGMSATPDVLPPEYADSYPDVAVGNLGEDGFFYTHNRQTHTTTIVNPGNNSGLIWDSAGFITYESSVAHAQAGQGAKEGAGSNTHHVLTEATIDIFTCMPVGGNRDNTGIGQGSEYLQISHISQSTVDAFNGQPPQDDTSKSPALSESLDDNLTYTDIVNKSGETVMKVPIERTDKMIQRSGKQVKRILVCHTEGECFPVMANKFTTTDTNAHFLVGQREGTPEVLAENGDKAALKNSGFYQFIDLDNDAGAYSNATIDGEKANVDAVVIMLVGDSDSCPNSYQLGILDKLITHIRTKADNFDIPVVSTNEFDTPIQRSLMPNFSADDYNE